MSQVVEYIKLDIETKEQTVYTTIPSPTEENKAQVIAGVFQLFGASVPVKAEPVKTAPIQAAAPAPGVKATPAVKHVANNTTVQGEPQTMEEALTPAHVPEYYKTGIKVKDGVKHYKCYYRCTKCGHKGNHYIPEGVEQVDCHECQTSLQVKKAVPGSQGLSEKDKFGNWYVAGDQRPINPVVENFVQNRLRK